MVEAERGGGGKGRAGAGTVGGGGGGGNDASPKDDSRRRFGVVYCLKMVIWESSISFSIAHTRRREKILWGIVGPMMVKLTRGVDGA